MPAGPRQNDGQESAAVTGPDLNRIIVCGVWPPTLLLLLPAFTDALELRRLLPSKSPS